MRDLLIFSVVAVLCGCGEAPAPRDAGVPSFSGQGGGPSGGGQGGNTVVAPPPPTSCQVTLDCMFACPSGETACQEACYAKGSTEGNGLLLALAQCVDTMQCNDGDCIVTQCGQELLDCAGASRPQSVGAPLQGSLPPGSVPADLVGRWAGARDGQTERLLLGGDGSGTWESILTTQYYACSTSSIVTRTGTIVVGEKTMTLAAGSVVRSERVCTPGATEEPLSPETYVMHWSRSPTDANVIFLVDEACAARFPGQENCEYAGCPIGMYCTARLTRE